MRRRIHDHSSVLAERLVRLLEDGLCEDADVGADVAGGGDHGFARDGHHPEIDAVAAWVGEGFGGGEVGEVVGVVADVEEGGFGGEVGVVFFNLDVDLGFEVEMVDYGSLRFL